MRHPFDYDLVMIVFVFQVHIDDEYQYAVVQFLELPRSNIDDYVCVPHSWIRTVSYTHLTLPTKRIV